MGSPTQAELMAEILKALSDWLLFFFAEDRYRLVDSSVSRSMGNASVTFVSDKLRWRLVRDRSQLFLDCRPEKGHDDLWYSVDLFMRLFDDKAPESAVLTQEMSVWVEQKLPWIEEAFSEEKSQHTISDLKVLKRQRAKELFG